MLRVHCHVALRCGDLRSSRTAADFNKKLVLRSSALFDFVCLIQRRRKNIKWYE